MGWSFLLIPQGFEFAIRASRSQKAADVFSHNHPNKLRIFRQVQGILLLFNNSTKRLSSDDSSPPPLVADDVLNGFPLLPPLSAITIGRLSDDRSSSLFGSIVLKNCWTAVK